MSPITPPIAANTPRSLLRLCLRTCALLALTMVGVMAAALIGLKARESELVFRIQESNSSALSAPQLPESLRATIPTADGTKLAGILLRATAQRDNGFWILHLHGNADSAFSDMQRQHIEILNGLGFSVLAFDYRGFGLSSGEASETNMYQDAEAAFQYLVRNGAAAKNIILWGHSLGGGPATYLAAKNKAAALVLFGAFTSVPEAAQDAYPYLPVKWVAGIQFDSRARLAEVRIPVLIAHSLTDTIIYYRHAQELFAAANEPKQLLPLRAAPDGFGGHVRALYDRPDLIADRLSKLLGGEIERL